MPRYFFHIQDGRYVVDEEGADFSSIAAAEQEAIASARSILREAVWVGKLPLGERIDIADEQGRVLRSVNFRDAVEIED
jgi:hypothetical protein